MSNIININEKASVNKKRRLYNKRLLVSIILFVVITLGYLGYKYTQSYYAARKAETTRQEQVDRDKAQKKIEGTYINTGDNKNSKLDYIARLDDGNIKAAASVYEQVIAKASTDDEKARLYQEYYTVANYSKQYDQALVGALGYNDLRPSFEWMDRVARTYNSIGDKANEVIYLKKMKSLLDSSKPENAATIADIDQRLAVTGIEK